MKTLYQDIRYALRQLRNAPAFTATAVLTLALGIGANTAVFTLMHEVMLKSLPVHDPGGLYRVGDRYECCIEGSLQDDWNIFSYPQYEYFIAHTPEWEQLAAAQTNRPDLSVRRQGANAAESFQSEMISGNYFSVMGLNAYAGRLISPEDDREGAPPVVVMSYRAWQQKYGLDRSLVGGTLMINGTPMTLIGIAPPGFYGDRRESDPPDFWLPIALEPAMRRENSIKHLPRTAWLYLLGRLRPGARADQVSAHLTTELRQFLTDPTNINPNEDTTKVPKQIVHVTSAPAGVNAMEESARGLYILMAASGVILLIACANVANLLLARGAATRVRTSLQLAVGATRSRVIRAGLTESVLLAVFGGIAGVGLAYFATKAMLALAFRGSDYVPISASPSISVLAFTFGVALLTGIIFGLAPAWMASSADPAEALRGASRSSKDSSAYGQKTLVIIQAALSLVLLTAAGLLTQTLRNLQNQQFGFERQGRLITTFSPEGAGYTQERLMPLYQQMEERFSHLPGVISESLAMYTAQQGNNWGEGVYIAGKPPSHQNGSSWDRVGVHYFETIGTPIVQGRGFRESDTATSQHVAVVSEAFVKKFFPNGENPIGQHFGKDEPSHAGDYEIVGVSKDAKYQDASRPARAMFFVPLPQTIKYEDKVDTMVESASITYLNTLVLHVQGDPRNFESQVRQTLASIDPSLVPLSMHSFDEQIEIRSNERTLLSRLTSAFGLLALLLASIGLYGLTAYQVTRRTGEIGLRMALGANRLNIVRMVLRGAFLQVGIGLVIGIPLVFLAGKLMASQLFGVRSFEPAILMIAVLVLGLCALIASVLPARRAAGIDPMRALRTE